MEIELAFENYEIYANPKIIAITDIQEFGWERCCSFPSSRAQVKRPIGIVLSYQDETGEVLEKGILTLNC